MMTKPCDTCSATLVCAIPEQPPTVEFQADGLFVKQMGPLATGYVVPQHSHEHDHLTMLVAGSVQVHEAGVPPRTCRAPDGIFIKAHVKHTFVAMADATLLYCIHNTTRTGSVEVAEEHHIMGAGSCRSQP